MPISDWPKAERPRERLLLQGAHTLSDAELLAIFFRTGTPGKTAVDLARECLLAFGGLRKLLVADSKTFCEFKGLGQAKYAQLQATLEMVRRHLAEPLQIGETIGDPRQAKDSVHARLRDYPYEVFAMLYLDNHHRVIAFEELFRGTIDNTMVPVREVVSTTLRHNASAVILAHNHPSGVSEPSLSDRNLTRKLSQALALVGVRILDHFVVGDTTCCSFAERGLL